MVTFLIGMAVGGYLVHRMYAAAARKVREYVKGK